MYQKAALKNRDLCYEVDSLSWPSTQHPFPLPSQSFLDHMAEVEVVALAISKFIAEDEVSDDIKRVWQNYSVCLTTNPEDTSNTVVDTQILPAVPDHSNASIFYHPLSTAGAYSESKLTRTKVQLFNDDGHLMASSLPEWRAVSKNAASFTGDVYWGSESTNPALSFTVTLSFAIDEQTGLRESWTLKSVCFSLNDIEQPLKFHDQRWNENLRLKSLSALLSISRESTNSIKLEPLRTHYYSPITVFQLDDDKRLESPLFNTGDTTFQVTIYDSGVARAFSEHTPYSSRPHWDKGLVSMDLDLWGPGIGNKLSAKLLFKVDKDRKGESVFEMLFSWSEFNGYIDRSTKWE